MPRFDKLILLKTDFIYYLETKIIKKIANN